MAAARKKPKLMSWKLQILMIFIVLAAIAAMSTTVLIFIGMLPTLVAFAIDRTKDKTRVLSVGAMNLAGCSPFVLQLWTTENNLENALTIVTDPRTVIVMYSAAGVGYLIDWAISGLIGGIMVQRATARRSAIEKRKEDLIARWGREVTGEIMVDAQGFAIGGEEPPDDKPKTEK